MSNEKEFRTTLDNPIKKKNIGDMFFIGRIMLLYKKYKKVQWLKNRKSRILSLKVRGASKIVYHVFVVIETYHKQNFIY